MKKTLWMIKPSFMSEIVFGNLTNLDAVKLKEEAGLKSMYMLACPGLTETPYEEALGKAHITVNKNAVPNDPQKPFVTSGLRIGTPAVTTRGYREADCVALANWICDVLDAPENEKVLAGVRENVTKQCREFPVYG